MKEKQISLFAELNKGVEAIYLQDESSNEAIFYPWGKGGEGYLLNNTQKQRVGRFVKASLALIFASWFTWVCLNIYSFVFFMELYWVLVFTTTTIFLLYVLGVFISIKNMSLRPKYVEIKSIGVPAITKELLKLTLVLFMIFIFSYLSNSENVFTIVSGIFSVFFYPLAALFFAKRKKAFTR